VCRSAELIAVSSLLTYDVYRTYINPKAAGHTVRHPAPKWP
jgi:Na+/proline symporter